jgi:plastocyanin
MRLFIASLAVLLVTGACSNGSESAPEAASENGGTDATATISAVDNAFEPTEFELPAGEVATVSFTNNGDATHTFTSEELGFDSGSVEPVEPGETVEVTFTAPDQDTAFVCAIHEQSDGMVGTMVTSS